MAPVATLLLVSFGVLFGLMVGANNITKTLEVGSVGQVKVLQDSDGNVVATSQYSQTLPLTPAHASFSKKMLASIHSLSLKHSDGSMEHHKVSHFVVHGPGNLTVTTVGGTKVHVEATKPPTATRHLLLMMMGQDDYDYMEAAGEFSAKDYANGKAAFMTYCEDTYHHDEDFCQGVYTVHSEHVTNLNT